MPEEKKRSGVKVCGWLSDEVFSKLLEKGYKSHTIIVRHGAELIIGQPIGEHGELIEGTVRNKSEQIEDVKEQTENTEEQREQIEEQGEQLKKQREQVEALKTELDKAENDKKEHIEAIGELRELRAQVRGQREQLEEKDRHIDTLKGELNRAVCDKEDLKTTYNNYFLQVQTLINQKAIEAPGAKKPWWQFW
jgi:predicted RNase H-like nuclease (RuvC/YqgF family)